MLILQLQRGEVVTSANTAADGVLPNLRDYWGDVAAVWDTTGRSDHLAACEARAAHPDGSVTVSDSVATILDSHGNSAWSGPVTAID